MYLLSLTGCNYRIIILRKNFRESEKSWIFGGFSKGRRRPLPQKTNELHLLRVRPALHFRPDERIFDLAPHRFMLVQYQPDSPRVNVPEPERPALGNRHDENIAELARGRLYRLLRILEYDVVRIKGLRFALAGRHDLSPRKHLHAHARHAEEFFIYRPPARLRDYVVR